MGHVHHEMGHSWGLSLQVSWTCMWSPSLEDPFFFICVCLSVCVCVYCMLRVHVCSSAGHMSVGLCAPVESGA